MISKVLLTFFALHLFVCVGFAQTRKIEVNISMENTNLFGRKDLPVKVEITNKTEEVLDARMLEGMSLYLSRRLKSDESGKRDEKYIAFAAVPHKSLKKDESLNFEINLAGLYWKDEISSTIDLSYPKNFAAIPAANRRLYAVVHISTNNSKFKESDFQISESFESNEILTTLKSQELKK